MLSKWWKISDENILDFLKAKEVKADLSTFYIGELVDVVVDGKSIKRRCFDTPSGNTINVKGYRVCYDDFDEPVEEIESKLNKRSVTTMQMDWNTIKSNRVIKNDYHDQEIYRQGFACLVKDKDTEDFDNSPYGKSHFPGSYRVLVDGNYETEFSAENDEEAIQKFKDYFAELPNPEFLYREVKKRWDLSKFKGLDVKEIEDEILGTLGDPDLTYEDFKEVSERIYNEINSSRKVIKSSEDDKEGKTPYWGTFGKDGVIFLTREEYIEEFGEEPDEKDAMYNSRKPIKSESSWNARVQEIMDEEGVTREEAEDILNDAFCGQSRKITSRKWNDVDSDPYTYYIDLTNTGYYEDGYLRIVPDQGDDTRFHITAADQDGNVIKEGTFKFDDIIGNQNAYSYYIDLTNTGYYDSPILRIIPMDGDDTRFRISANDKEGNEINSDRFDFNEILFGSITSGCGSKGKKKKGKKAIKSAEHNGWVVESWEAQEAYDMACDYFGKEWLDSEIVTSLSSDELADSLAWIFNQYDFREWDNRHQEIESGKKAIKSSVDELYDYAKHNWVGECDMMDAIQTGNFEEVAKALFERTDNGRGPSDVSDDDVYTVARWLVDDE